MSSAVLYLAIVAVWAIVLVPMWLRRDGEATGIHRLLHKRPAEEEPAASEEEPAEPPAEQPRPRPRPGRAAVIARRRRRTSGLTLLLLTTAVIVAAGLAPWWITLPPALLLGGHLSLLRVAVGMDAARQREAAAAAAAAARAAAEARAEEARREEAANAEIIELVPSPDEVFDQYADDRRAVGE
ncbi:MULTISPECIES: hypothetical protein [Actinomadura]|uniref:Uncharacterized protein n=1 Tax=Actinomadura yumaensis TaxID=111807 RepID=A0ABW2CW68_9ACTN|nr:hypothetical protein [Actinomadura sp. J1-007]MWK34102.1 hypothetical protein [Actinomadura sp. J1-007]